MESRPYFICGDLLACAGTGALVGLACAAMIGTSWNMLLAMIVGMVLGMALAMVLLICFLVLFGAMEVMLPGMLAGMLAGMVVSMAGAMSELSKGDGAALGTVLGVSVMIFTYAMNACLCGKVDSWTR